MFSLERWAKRAKCTLTPKQSRAIGGALAAKCRTHDVVMGYEPSRHHHGRPPRTFPRAILDLYFSRLLDKHAPALQLSLVKAEIA